MQREKSVHQYTFFHNAHVWCNSSQSRDFSSYFFTDIRDVIIKSQLSIKRDAY